MQHLDNINEVGRGIAVAFVATIYGVGIANLFFLPFAGKMRIRIRDGHRRREMMLEGVISILEGMNPRMLEIKLAGFLDDSAREKNGARRMSRRVPRSRVTHDRWLVSYADFITLLVRFLRGPLRICQGRPEKTSAGIASDRLRLPLPGRLPRAPQRSIERLRGRHGPTSCHAHEHA